MLRQSGGMTIPPLDPFSQTFDSIEVDSNRTPAREAIEHAMAYVAPQTPIEPPAPGFYLLNDGNGRFYEGAPGRNWSTGLNLAYSF